MSDQTQNQPGTQPPPPPPGPIQYVQPPQAAGETPEQYAQRLSQLNNWAQSIGAREKSEGRAQIEREIAEKLGCTLDEAAAKLKAVTDAEAANLTEAQRLMAEATTKDTQASATIKQAHDLLYEMLCQDALMNLGMNRTQAKQAIGLMRVPGDTVTLEGVVAAAEAVKLGFPQLFAAGSGGNGAPPGATDGQPSGPPHSAAPGAPAGSAGSNSPKDRAMARLRGEQGGRLRSDPLPREPTMDYRRSS